MAWEKKKINEIFKIEKGTLQSSKNIPGDYAFITASTEWKTHESYSHDCEALIFAMGASGSLGRTHYVNGKFIASDLCFILTQKKGLKLNLKFYHTYFNLIRESIVAKIATGSTKLAINKKIFENYEIIYGDIEEQNKISGLMEYCTSLEKEVEDMKSNVKSLIENILIEVFEQE